MPVVAWPEVLAAVFWDALLALVCELVAGMPVLVPAAVVPVWAVVVLGVVEVADVELLMSPVLVVEVELGVVLEAEVLGVVVEAVLLMLPVALGVVVLPAVVEGPVAEAEVPGAEALVLLAVEAVPVWADVPAAVVVLPGVADEALGVVVLGVVVLAEVDGVVELLMLPVVDELLLG